ncbi:ribonuclease domain-containing protein [Hydrogenophaga sp.]|uniref:ribonuclease domain-containing protein n=1 Tax=Hydrogenophaga sp. TaxID=1904254 RepID=UPI0039FD6E14
MGLNRIWSTSWRVKRVFGLAAAVALTGMLSTALVQARAPVPPSSPDTATASVTWSGLPLQGRQVMEQIREGGPFRYEKDGTVFGNRERLLPIQKRGFYREYTVPTPGLRHRGAKRIVCGGFTPQVPDACYYTEDHYNSFKLIVQ